MLNETTNGAPSRPELVIGLVAAIGTPIDRAVHFVEDALDDHGYTAETLHLSRYTDRFQLGAPPVPSSPTFAERLDIAMRRGSEVRDKTDRHDILALSAVADIYNKRLGEKKGAYILRQLKHPEEIYLLRKVYGDCFLVVGFYMPLDERQEFLACNGVRKEEMEEFISRDYHEGIESGQRFRDTFHLVDVFMRLGGDYDCKSELNRFFSLVLGTSIVTPRLEEFGMYHAYGAALRSAQMGRQVGASILSDLGDLISVGTNEVPKAFGGSYWEGLNPDERDHKQGIDSNDKVKREIAEEILANFKRSGLLKTDAELDADGRGKEVSTKANEILEQSRVGSLIEFGRAVHAEADALASALRLGISPRGSSLFCTTFPCHLCAKQIVSSGITEVTFIEPYPKSLAGELHGDAIAIEDDSKVNGKVKFKPFVGVAPRRYGQVFSSVDYTGRPIDRKERNGQVRNDLFHPRLRHSEHGILLREQQAAEEFREIVEDGWESEEKAVE